MTTPSVQTVPLGVGIDTARYGHHVTFLLPDRQPAAPPVTIAESGTGYQQLQRQLEQLARKHPQAHFHVRIDAAGQYASNLERFLRGLDLPLTVSIGEPKRNKDYHQAIFPKRKADPTESHAMARYALVEQPPASEKIPEEISILREIAGRLQGAVKDTTQAINRLHNLLARVFPELALHAPNVGAGWVLKLLEKYPTPERITRAALSSLAKIPHLGTEKAKKIQAAARETVGSLHGNLTEELVRQAVLQVGRCQQAENRLEDLLLEAFHALPRSGHTQVETIPGIGPVTAAILTAKIVDMGRFATPEKLVGYFGVFPEEHSSGVDRDGRPLTRRTHMSRKGNDLVRRYLFCAAKSAIPHNPAVRALYKRLRARATRRDVALGHCMRKLLHLVFAVWKSDKPFEKNHYRWEGPDQAAPAADSVAEPAPAPQEAAGPKRDVLPARKEVTAAITTVDPTPGPVNGKPQPVVQDERTGSVDYAYLRGQITIEQVLRRLGHFQALRGHTQLRGPCPLHLAARENSRSFSVNLKKNVFRCLDPNCARQGNALDLWAAYHRLPIYEAALHLAHQFGFAIRPVQR